ncbi:MAG: 5'/3'-nucleotidase SurE [Deltaproteobacteria bacterium]|nr:5'/3'-nucleotidase SurE [Deltaproteobacteria bacterium]MBW2071866.1 5'/3'-nucleotidase SurE [Deltaproteobacteria bacterium]
MMILLTNDDGIYAKGIEVLQEHLCQEHEVLVVAPETEQSAVGHAITLMDPLRLKPIQRNGAFFGYGVNGTPADCVKLAINELLEKPPNLVVSGINLGANVGINVIYSGTVSAATEGAILGVPAIAVSINSFKSPDFTPAARFIKKLVRQVSQHGLPPCTLLNVNVPAVPAEKIRGVRITRQGVSRFVEKFDRRVDPRKNVYYWQCGSTPPFSEDGDTDASALASDCISITPLHFDLTNYGFLETLRTWNIAAPGEEE